VSRFALQGRNRWLLLFLVFGIGPLIFYLALIHPAVQRITKYRETILAQANEPPSVDMNVSPASNQEIEQLQHIRGDRLFRVKKIAGRGSLLRFSGALADALAAKARLLGAKVQEVSLENSSINGKYLPAGQDAIDILQRLPGPQWEELSDPLELPLLKLPSIEVRMILVAGYAQVFSFVAALPDFPSLVQLVELHTGETMEAKLYYLKIRGYYYSTENPQQTAQSFR
jgi:hypothetical protein